MGPNQVLPIQAREDIGPTAMKGALPSPKFQHHWKLTLRLLSVINWTFLGGGGGSYPTAEKQSVYSTDPADWAIHPVKYKDSFILDNLV